ncbi:MAG: hypothetical protein K0S53_372 [Bacteroidetes bacterium]|jgi:hypothetical protein|nr:hypothetical protein [Bacteroidota bacterium]
MSQELPLDRNEFEKLYRIIAELKSIAMSKMLDKNWLPLPMFLEHYNISRQSWGREYKNKIKYRDDGIKIWVHVPSMEKYLMDKSIN